MAAIAYMSGQLRFGFCWLIGKVGRRAADERCWSHSPNGLPGRTDGDCRDTVAESFALALAPTRGLELAKDTDASSWLRTKVRADKVLNARDVPIRQAGREAEFVRGDARLAVWGLLGVCIAGWSWQRKN